MRTWSEVLHPQHHGPGSSAIYITPWTGQSGRPRRRSRLRTVRRSPDDESNASGKHMEDKTAFWSWCECRNPENDPVNDIGADALEATNDCDVVKFKVQREKVVSQLAGRYLRNTERVYEYDVENGRSA